MRTNRIYLLLTFLLVNLTQSFAQVTWEYGTNIYKDAYDGKSLKALNSIVLTDGFEVLAGATFTATIDNPSAPAPVNLSQLNYTKTTILLKDGKKTASDIILTPLSDKLVTYVYEDGFGRPIQQVNAGASPSGFDMVQHVAYDQYGDQSAQFLPYVSNTRNGAYQADAGGQQLEFYSRNGDKIANDAKPYSTAMYNDSPIARLLEQGGPGADWQLGSGHTLKVDLALNKGSDGVLIATASGRPKYCLSDRWGNKNWFKWL